MNTLNRYDLIWLLRMIPQPVKQAMQLNPGRVFLAGGAIRSSIAREPISDFDLFVPDRDSAVALANSLAKDKDRALDENGLLPGIHTTENAYTIKHFKPMVQIIHRWTFDDPAKCIDSFDFTIAQACIWNNGQKWESAVSGTFYADLAARRLIYTSPKRIEEVGGSMLRILKFYQRGYRVSLDSLGAVMARVFSALDRDKIDLRDESAVARVVTALLIEVDPNVDPDHLAHLPSEQDNQNA